MYILGDIGNTETKIWLVSKKNKIIKKINFSSKEITNNKLSTILILLYFIFPSQLIEVVSRIIII